MMETLEQVERRSLGVSEIELRYVNRTPRLVGYAAVYDELSRDLGGFRERIAPGAFAEHLRSEPDVVALVDHDPGKIIGRTTAGTLSLHEDRRGVQVEIDVPDTSVGRDVVTSVKRGDLSGMSIGFHVTDDRWESRDGGTVRTVRTATLVDASVCALPAYDNTEIAVRSMDRWKETAMPVVETPAPKSEVETASPAEVTIPKTETPEVSLPKPERRSAPPEPSHETTAMGSHDPAEWRNYATGKPVRVLKPEQRFADQYKGEPLSLGKTIRALTVGDWSDAPLEQRALSTTANPTAGILVPNPLAASVIDLARAKSVLMQAGARTVDMTASTLTIARVSTDPTMEVHTENAAFTGSDTSFDAVELTAYTIGTVVKMSRELAADAPNSVQLIEDTLAKALAAKIDWYGLRGTGSAMPLGLINFASTNTEAVGGSVDYDNILNGITECEIDNHDPNAVVVSPTNANVLRQLKVNSEANHYAMPPAAVTSLRSLATSAMPDTTMAVGDFTQFLIGLRQGATIEVSTEAGNAFEQHAVYIKVTWRGAFSAAHQDAFCLLTGIV